MKVNLDLVDVYPDDGHLHLFVPFMDSDLGAVIGDPHIFLSPADYMSYMQPTRPRYFQCAVRNAFFLGITRPQMAECQVPPS